jgi:CheY-specific phosphatase CheX
MLYSGIIKNRYMKNLVIEPGKRAEQSIHARVGWLIGSIKGAISYSNLDETAFKVLVTALMEVLDPNNAFDALQIKQLIAVAEQKGFNVSEVVKEVNLIHE